MATVKTKSKLRRSVKRVSRFRLPDKQALSDIFFQQEYLLFLEGSLEDFYALDEQKAEYLDGGIVVMHSPASVQHEEIFMDLATKLKNRVDKKKTGKVFGSRLTVVLGEHRFEPDIVFIAADNPGQFTELEFIGAPDMIIEIVSKTSRDYDLKTKREIYQQFRVKEIYFVDYTTGVVIADYLTEKGYTSHKIKKGVIASKVVEGFEVECYGKEEQE